MNAFTVLAGGVLAQRVGANLGRHSDPSDRRPARPYARASSSQPFARSRRLIAPADHRADDRSPAFLGKHPTAPRSLAHDLRAELCRPRRSLSSKHSPKAHDGKGDDATAPILSALGVADDRFRLRLGAAGAAAARSAFGAPAR